jgi:DNA polymerase sigma
MIKVRSDSAKYDEYKKKERERFAKRKENEKPKNSVYRKQYRSKSIRARPDMLSFYERDDNSRIATSRSDTITRKGLKKQRRLLQDPLLNLHK